MTENKLSSGVVHLQRINDRKLQQARILRKNMTIAEKKLWARLRRKQVLGIKFRRQQIIEGFIVDFFCNAAKLVIEIDGGIHETDEQQLKDEHRRNVFKLRGLKEIRFNNDEVLNSLNNVVCAIRDCVKIRI